MERRNSLRRRMSWKRRVKKTQKGKGKKVGEVRYVRRKVNPVHGREVVVMENGGIAGRQLIG